VGVLDGNYREGMAKPGSKRSKKRGLGLIISFKGMLQEPKELSLSLTS
jgi:hypothetical protein